MKIRKATKKDFKKYLELVRISDREYSKIIGKRIKTIDKEVKKYFDKSISSKNHLILVAENNNNLVGYLVASLFIGINNKFGYIDHIFVSQDYRKNKIGELLVKEFRMILKKKKLSRIKLAVNIRNKRAIKFYRKLGFKTYSYEMELK